MSNKIYIIMNRWECDSVDYVVSYSGDKLPLKEMYEVYERNWDMGERRKELKRLGLEILDYDIVPYYCLERAAREGRK